MKKSEPKKTLKLQKETLVRLQENQMQALIGAEQMTTDSGAACGNTVDVPIKALGAQRVAIEKSCCRRSC